MRLVNFRYGNTTVVGVQRGDFVYSLSSIYGSDMEFFAAGDQALKSAGTLLAQNSPEAIPLQNGKLLAPVLKPGKILCVGLKYRDHAIESHMAIPEVPTIFLKLPNAVIGPDAEIVLPRNSTQPDYE